MSHASPHPTQPSGSPAWILVVDDERSILAMFSDMLEETGLETVGAPSADEALARISQRASEPLIVFIDVMMPGTNGLTLARKLRSRFKQGRIVLMSGHLTDVSWWPDDLRDVEFMPKPFRRDEVLEKVAAARRSLGA